MLFSTKNKEHNYLNRFDIKKKKKDNRKALFMKNILSITDLNTVISYTGTIYPSHHDNS